MGVVSPAEPRAHFVRHPRLRFGEAGSRSISPPPITTVELAPTALGGMPLHSTTQAMHRSAVLQMQRAMGNRAVQRQLQQSPSPRIEPPIQRCVATHCNCPAEEQSGMLRREKQDASGTRRRQRDSPADGWSLFVVQRLLAPLDEAASGGVAGGFQPQLLVIGSLGDAVIMLQQLLNRSGEPSLEADGHFGPLTRSRVVQFQSDAGLVPDGMVGEKTWDALLFGSGEEAESVKPAAAKGLGAGGLSCNYEPGEAEESQTADGAVEQQSGPTVKAGSALLHNFGSGKIVLKPAHKAFLEQLIRDHALNSAGSSAEVVIMEGHTDCVDTEEKNFAIRAGRAEAVRAFLIEKGALNGNLGPAVPATSGELPGSDATRDGRARNRSTFVQVKLRVKPKPTPPPAPNTPLTCQSKSNDWELEATASAELVVGGGVVLIPMILRNRAAMLAGRKCEFAAEYSGLAGGLATGLSIGINPSGGEKFTTLQAVTPQELEGKAQVFSASISWFIGGVEEANIKLFTVDTGPSAWIPIGGFELIGTRKPKVGAGFFISEGKFSVGGQI